MNWESKNTMMISFKFKMIRSFQYLLIAIFIVDPRLGNSALSEISCPDDNFPCSPSFHHSMISLNPPLCDDTNNHFDHNNLFNPSLTPSLSPFEECGFDDSFNRMIPSVDEEAQAQCLIPPEILISSYRCENENLLNKMQELCHEFGSLEYQLLRHPPSPPNDPCFHRPNEFIMGSIMPLFDRMNLLILERVNLQDQYHKICKELPSSSISIMENLDFQYQTQFSQLFTHFLSRIQDLLLPPFQRIPTYAESCRRLQESLQKSVLLTAALEKVRDLQNQNAELIFNSHGVNTKEYVKKPNSIAPKKTIASSLLARKGGHEFHISIHSLPGSTNQKIVIVNNNTDTAVLMSLDRLSVLKKVLKEMLYATKVNDLFDFIRWDPLEGALIDPENGFLVTSSGVKSFDVKNMFILYNGDPNELFIEVEGIRYRIIFEHHEAAEKILHDKLKYSIFKLVLDKPCNLIENGHPIKFHIRRVSQSAPITFGGGDEIVVNGQKTNLLTNLVLDVPNRTLRANFLDDVRKNKVILLDDHMTALLDKLILQKLLPISSI